MASKKSSNKPADNPKGNGPKLKTREEHAAAKKAAKARQARNRDGAGNNAGVTKYRPGNSGYRNERPANWVSREEYKARQRAEAAMVRSINQADAALALLVGGELEVGTIAYRAAELTIQHFPIAEAVWENGERIMSKTRSAERFASAALREELGQEEFLRRQGAVSRGYREARQALKQAFDTLQELRNA